MNTISDSQNSIPEILEIWQQTLNWQPNQLQQQQFQHLYELILAANKYLNLTRITTPEDFWEKHLWDSLKGIAQFLNTSTTSPLRAIDIGTGGGFPGIPIAIALLHCHVTLLDSTRKKIAFIETIIPQLNLNNITALTGRAEEIGQQTQHRQAYDLALIRAVAPASVCAEYALPLLKENGLAILYRGQWTEEETEALQLAIKNLGGVIESIEAFTTPISNSQRTCLYLKKIATTPANFPRPVGIPTQKPL
ncbi:MAG TPA: 16S rRNA (guanine(527)-N(7))-methyltransferase RsmG [Oculatellaceae cyanobacterium]